MTDLLDRSGAQSAQQFEGFWHIPGTPSPRVFGRLTVFPDQYASLWLEGDLALQESAAILGTTSSGEKISLLNAVAGRFTQSTVHVEGEASVETWGGIRTEWVGEAVVIGMHLASLAAAMFQSAAVDVDDLFAWVHQSAVAVDGRTSRTSAQVLDAQSWGGPIPGSEASIKIVLSGSAQHSLRQAVFKSRAWVSILPDAEQPISWFWDCALSIKNLFVLLTGAGSRIARVQLLTKNLGERAVVCIPSEARRDDVHPPSMTPVAFESVRDKLAQIIERWLASQKAVAAAHEAFFRLYLTRAPDARDCFLSLCQALEGFHRRRFSGHYVTEEQFSFIREALVNALPADTPRDLRDKIQGSLRFANEVSLRSRLRELLEHIGEPVGVLTPRPKDFVGKIVDARNRLTHLPTGPTSSALPGGVALIQLTRRLHALLALLLLHEAGLTYPEAAEALRRGFVWRAALLEPERGP